MTTTAATTATTTTTTTTTIPTSSTPIKISARQLNRAAGSQSLEQLKAAIATGWTREDIDQTLTTSESPVVVDKNAVHMAAWKGGLDQLHYLVDEMGCNINVIATGRHSHGKTPLFFACTQSRPQHVQFLLDRGARVTIVNNNGQSVRSLAFSHFPKNTLNNSSSRSISNTTTPVNNNKAEDEEEDFDEKGSSSIPTTKYHDILHCIMRLEQEQEQQYQQQEEQQDGRGAGDEETNQHQHNTKNTMNHNTNHAAGWINYRATHSDGLDYDDLDPRFLDRPIRSTDVVVWPWCVNPTTPQSRQGNFARNNPHVVVAATAAADHTKPDQQHHPTRPDHADAQYQDGNGGRSGKRLYTTLSVEQQAQLDALWQTLSKALIGGGGGGGVEEHDSAIADGTHHNSNNNNNRTLPPQQQQQPPPPGQVLLQILTLCDTQQRPWIDEAGHQLRHVWIQPTNHHHHHRQYKHDRKDQNDQNNHSCFEPAEDVAATANEETDTDSSLIDWLKTIPPQDSRQRSLLHKLASRVWLQSNTNQNDPDTTFPLDKNDFLRPLLEHDDDNDNDNDKGHHDDETIVKKQRNKKVSMAMQSLETGLWPMACQAVQGLSFAQSLTEKPRPKWTEPPLWLVQVRREKQRRQQQQQEQEQQRQQEAKQQQQQQQQEAEQEQENNPTTTTTPATQSQNHGTESDDDDDEAVSEHDWWNQGEEEEEEEGENSAQLSSERIIGLKSSPIWIDSVEGLQQLWQTLALPQQQLPWTTPNDDKAAADQQPRQSGLRSATSLSSNQMTRTNTTTTAPTIRRKDEDDDDDDDNVENINRMDVVGIDTEWTDSRGRPRRNTVSTFQLAMIRRSRPQTTRTTTITQEQEPDSQQEREKPAKEPDLELQTFVVDILPVQKNPEYRKICREFLKVLFQSKIILGFAANNDIPKLEHKFNHDGRDKDDESLSLYRGNLLDLQRLWPKKQQPGLATCAKLYHHSNSGGEQPVWSSKEGIESVTAHEDEGKPENANEETAPNVATTATTRDEDDEMNSNTKGDKNRSPVVVKLSKAQQCSNWKRRPLRPEQLEYAALDAAVLLVILAEKARAEASKQNK